jgi:hypothetical protein
MCQDEVCGWCQDHNLNGHMVDVTKYNRQNTRVYICDTCGMMEIIGPPKKGGMKNGFGEIYDELLFSSFIDHNKIIRKDKC